MDDVELGDKVRFAVEELAPEVARAAGMEVEPVAGQSWDRPGGSTRAVPATLVRDAARLRLAAGGTYRDDHDGSVQCEERAVLAAVVLEQVCIAVLRWQSGLREPMRTSQVLGRVVAACELAREVLDDPGWQLRLHLVASGLEPDVAGAVADTATR